MTTRRAEDRIRDAEIRVTWRSTMTLGFLTAMAPFLALTTGPWTSVELLVCRMVTIVWAAAIIGVLVARHRALTLRTVQIAYGLMPVPLFPTFWFLAVEQTHLGLSYEVFVRENLVVVLYALTTPPTAVMSLVVIAAFAVESILVFAFGPSWGMTVDGAQPWINLMYAGCAVAIALFRSDRLRSEARSIVEREQAAAMRKLGRAYLAVCDLANTPLQNLELAISMLLARHPDAADLAIMMERAISRLGNVNNVLATETSKIQWGTAEESFDPFAAIRLPASGGTR